MTSPHGDSPGSMPYTFSIVGVQKAGTSTLEATLRRHRLVRRAPRKEAHFFDREDYDWSRPDYERDYHVPRTSRVHTAMGDSTPSYLFWPKALQRMHAYNPQMRLVAIFRDPIERAFSHWVMLRTRSTGYVDWPGFLEAYPDPRPPEHVDAGDASNRLQHLSGVGRGMYATQVERGLRTFPRDQWLFMEFRDVLARFDDHVNRATDHLGLPRFDAVPHLQHRYRGSESVPGTAPTASDLAGLARTYADELDRFDGLTGLDTTAWPTRRILDGTLDPGQLAAQLATRVRPG